VCGTGHRIGSQALSPHAQTLVGRTHGSQLSSVRNSAWDRQRMGAHIGRACAAGLAQAQQGWHRNNRAGTGTTGLAQAQQGLHSKAGTAGLAQAEDRQTNRSVWQAVLGCPGLITAKPVPACLQFCRGGSAAAACRLEPAATTAEAPLSRDSR